GTNPSNAETSSSGSAESTDQPETEPSAHAARLVVFGDSDFANNSLFPVQGNGNLFLNTVSWLAEEEDLIAIRPRKGGGSGPVMLTAAQAPLIFWLPVVLLPLGVFASGAVVFLRRKWQQRVAKRRLSGLLPYLYWRHFTTSTKFRGGKSGKRLRVSAKCCASLPRTM